MNESESNTPEQNNNFELFQLLKEERKRKLRRSLSEFTKDAWHVIEPGRQFVSGWHIDAISEHLEAVLRGDISNLIINIPPRHMKSIQCSVLFPAWCWLNQPNLRWIFGSYSAAISKRDSVKCRMLIESPWYQDTFKPAWKMKDDQNEKMRYENTATGARVATSVGGSGTGEGADIVVIDDPHNALEAESDTQRESVIFWFDNVISTRANDPKNFKKVVIMQRLNDKDLTGYLIEKEKHKWEHLCLPAEYEPKRISISSIGWKDPRTMPNELLWPEQFTREIIDDWKETLAEKAPGQLQQRPSKEGGQLFKRDWWKRYDEKPMDHIKVVQFWDSAQKPGITNDFSVCTTWMQTDSGFYLIDLFRGRLEYPELKNAAIDMFHAHRPDEVVIEDKSSGTALIQDLERETTIPVTRFEPTGKGDKVDRASRATPTVKSGNCFLPNGVDWAETFIQEHESFPFGSHDDIVDTTSMMVDHFKNEAILPNMRSL